ncbi:MAG TPA: ABC transporter substrate-binding protein, partial [Dongiaceae bacterium]
MLRGVLAARIVGVGAMSAMLLAPVPAQATQPDELVIGKSGDPDTLDPAVTVTNNSWTATYPAYERLLKFKVVDGKGSTEVEGDLAKSWSASDDGKTWTFVLGDGHVFADGSPLNAAAVKFSFDRVIKVAKGPGDLFGQVASIEAPDDH